MNKIKTEADLNRLVEAGTPESRDLEYKSEPYPKTDKGGNELAKDVSAFANAGGGQILIGVDEGKNNAAPKIIGVNCDADKENLRMGQIIHDRVAPRIPGLGFFPIPLTSDNRVLAIDIPSSIRKPHQVVKTGIFYVRQATEVQRLNVDELRPLFIGAETLMARAEAFRHERVDRFLAGEGIVKPGERGAAMLHIIPLSTHPLSGAVELRKVGEGDKFAPSRRECLVNNTSDDPCYSILPAYRLDGVAIFEQFQKRNKHYSFVFRHGAVEILMNDILYGDGGIQYIRDDACHRFALYNLRRMIPGLADLGISPPYSVSLSLLDVRKSVLIRDGRSKQSSDFPGKVELHRYNDGRNILPAPILIESGEFDGGETKSIFDSVYNAYGYSGAPPGA